MERILPLLGPLVLAFYVATQIAPSYDQIPSKKISMVFEKVAGVLLPLLILSIVRQAKITSDLWIIVIFGFFIPIAFYFLLPLISKNVGGPPLSGKQDMPNRLLFSSFGGGNRGNLILIVLIATGVVSEKVTPFYVALDFGNLLCVVTFGFYLLSKETNTEENNYRLSEVMNRVFKSPGFYAAIMVFLQLPGLKETKLETFFTAFDPIIKITGDILFPFFSFFVFLALFIRAEHITQLITKSKPIMKLSFASHVIPAAIIFLLALILNNEFFISTAVLIMMPPSSYLWSKITGTHRRPEEFEANYLVPNALYFLLLIGIYIYAAFN